MKNLRPNRSTLRRSAQGLVLIACLLTFSACSLLNPVAAIPPTFYTLDSPRNAWPVSAPSPTASSKARPTLIISPPHASAGLDSTRIIYVQSDHTLSYFAHNEWVDPPARMLGTLLVSALGSSGAFRAVVLSPSAATGELRLDTDLVRLQQDFQTQPSRVQFTLRATLVHDKSRRVLAWRTFTSEVDAPSNTPQGGVLAANAAVQQVLEALVEFMKNAPLDNIDIH